jgi:hypothetical protein
LEFDFTTEDREVTEEVGVDTRGALGNIFGERYLAAITADDR